MDHTDYFDYPDLDHAEPRAIELLTPEGDPYRTIWAAIEFCLDSLPAVPEVLYPPGSSWRVRDYVPPEEPEAPAGE